MRRILAVALSVLAAAAAAHWIAPNLHVPIARLIKNLTGELAKKPNDPALNYEIGRLHSMAFAEGEHETELYGSDTSPQFPPWSTVKVHKSSKGTRLTATELDHLRQSLIHYHEAVRLDPKTGLPRLGLAWMYDGLPVRDATGKAAVADDAHLGGRLAFPRTGVVSFDLSRLPSTRPHGGEHLMEVQDVFVSEDAGQGILRLEGSRLSPEERRQIESNVSTLKSRVDGITPIIFPLQGRGSLDTITTAAASVPFDMIGAGKPQQWSWVRPNAGILVWDPGYTGRIASGRQFFGSMTFWVFFRDGYEALASLDDNHDGWLTGNELRGIAVWCDRNGNGRSDPGEVVSAANLGIVAIRTTPTARNGTLSASDGIRFRGGVSAPTYDWLPSPKANDLRS